VIVVSSWTGFYVGLNAGYGWSNTEVDTAGGTVLCNPTLGACTAATGPVFTNAQVAAIPPALGTHPRGGVFGGQIGL
jgi:hypothetical protein